LQSENSFRLRILGSAGALYVSPSPPQAGIVYNQTASCVPPPPPQEDCVGSQTVCSNATISNSTNNTGLVQDLNSSNFGCLANAERQGTWYSFSSTTNGSIAFSIVPANASDDYDFAVWGPYPPGSALATICPPASQPIRCSYSGLTGTTGLNYTATDLSEGANGDKWVRYLSVTAGQIYLLYVSNWSQSGLAFNLNWNLGGSQTAMDCTPLPVELLLFEAAAAGTGVDLRWRTASEFNSLEFQVERSADGRDFEVLGSLPSAGDGAAGSSYAFRDHAPFRGLNYYRLQQVDISGAMEASEIRVVDMSGTGVTAWPNPTDGLLELGLPDAPEGQILIGMIDMYGRPVRSWMRTHATAGRIHLDMQGLAAGTYMLEIASRDGAFTHRIPVMKR
jgi:hypothetical protein